MEAVDRIMVNTSPVPELRSFVVEFLIEGFELLGLEQVQLHLADNYLETTVSYLSMYEQLLGPFPYAKFALVENFWETGYGMPSFTLLGPKVIRFPFILHSSYPHELLHNWWGNGVYVDYDGGNWCEGLTVYLADHLIKEQRNQAVQYRRNSLQVFADFVNADNDFPLTKFTRRTDSVTSSIGYNKAMMLWHMLRLELGDTVFLEGLKRFYRDNLFRRADYQDLRQAFETVTGQDLSPFFNQWLDRTDAAELAIIGARVEQEESGFRLFFTLVQNQEETPFRLTVPVAVTTADQHSAQIHLFEMTERRQDYSFSLQAKPLRLDVDPRFDLFRRLHNLETPPALSRVFGAPEALILLPSQADPDMAKGYRNLAETWGGAEQGPITIRLDNEIEILPTDRPVWVFGQENIHRATVGQTLTPYGVVMSESKIYMAGSEMMLEKHSLVAAGRNANNPKQIVVWLHADRVAALNGLGRKLPHYRKYSYLAFEGDEPVNVLKGQWPAVNSPMSVSLVTSDAEEATELPDLQLPPEKALIEPTPVFSAQAMMKHVEYLASSELEGRGLGSAGLDQAARYIAARFEEAGLKPAADDSTFFQSWEATAGPDESPATLRNVLAVLPGSNQDWGAQSVVVCAHYDHLGRGWPDVHQGDEGKIHFGADDNASGIAVLLELAAFMAKGAPPERNIVFAAFTGEENGRLGSKYYVQNMHRFPIGKIMCAINLDTVGRLNESKILILNSSTAGEWPHIFRGIGFVTGLEIDLSPQNLDSSDQISFIEKGIPALQIFSGAHQDFHRPTDTPDKIDAHGMAKIATATRELLVYLAARGEPLTASLHTTTSTYGKSKRGSRRVSTGIIPDFAFAGDGVRVDEAAPDSPASKAGLMKGDVIIAVDDSPVASLKSYSDILKTKEAGDTIKVRFRRGDQEKTVSVTLAPR